jgi:hypothetical protein
MTHIASIVTKDDAPSHAKPLVERLLGLGGDQIVLQASKYAVLEFVERGIVFPGAGSKRIKGGPSACHTNSAIQYLHFLNCQTGYESCEIATGYALSNDGMWRRHSWLWADGNVIETTVRRKLYFGMVLNPLEIEFFVIAEICTVLPSLYEMINTVAA